MLRHNTINKTIRLDTTQPPSSNHTLFHIAKTFTDKSGVGKGFTEQTLCFYRQKFVVGKGNISNGNVIAWWLSGSAPWNPQRYPSQARWSTTKILATRPHIKTRLFRNYGDLTADCQGGNNKQVHHWLQTWTLSTLRLKFNHLYIKQKTLHLNRLKPVEMSTNNARRRSRAGSCLLSGEATIEELAS